MRGAAMKVGQVLSMVELDGLPGGPARRAAGEARSLRDDVPPVPFGKLERLMREEFGGPVGAVFSEFEERAFAAASIGQVHRAVTLDGASVAVKVQYPGVAEAVETDMRNATLLLPLVKRLAPGLDVNALFAELARSDRRGARLRARGPESASGRAAAAGPSVHLGADG